MNNQNDTIKAVFFDIDGTLLDLKEHKLPESARRALAILKRKGIKIFIATGRSPYLIERSLEELRKLSPDGFVMLNGQYCLADGEVVRSQGFPVESLEKLIPWLDANDISCSFVEADYTYRNRKSRALKEYLAKGGHLPLVEVPIDTTDRIYEHPVYQLNPNIPASLEDEFVRRLPGSRSVRWNPLLIDVIPNNGGKDKGIAAVLDHYGWTVDQCDAFGDAENDIDMLRFAGTGIAMGNGDDSVKAAADYVTSDIEEDGIAKGLAHIGLLTEDEMEEILK